MTKEARIYNGEKTVSSTSGPGKTGQLRVKQQEHMLTLYTKINSKWFKDLNVRMETIKCLEENIGRTFFDINHSNTFLGQSPKAIEIKVKINKWDLIKFTNICTTMETINKMKNSLQTGRK